MYMSKEALRPLSLSPLDMEKHTVWKSKKSVMREGGVYKCCLFILFGLHGFDLHFGGLVPRKGV